MQGLYLNENLSYHNDLSLPCLGDNEALIKLSIAGICATDIELMKGYAGFSGILGHEFVGVVEAVANNNDQRWLNQRVVGSINIGCNHCESCLNDAAEHCLHRKVLGIRGKDGVFADYFTLPVANLFAVPDNISNENAVFTEPLAAAIRVLEQLVLIDVSNVAVVGPGRLGLLIAKVLSLNGYNVVVLGRSDNSLTLPAQWQFTTELIQHSPNNHYDCVVDATGQSSGFEQALRIVKPRGSLILKSTFATTEPIDLNKVVISEINIIGSRCGPFDKALNFLADNAIPVESMIDGQYALNQGLAGFEHANQSGVRKILLTP